MPASSLNPSTRKRFRILILFSLLVTPASFYGQSLTGLWTGSLSNDSVTSRKDQSFEIALTEYRGKVYGFSRSEFIVNDTLYYIVKRVKGTIDGDVCEVTDDEIISYNFIGKLDKGIKVTSTFKRNIHDSSWYLAGTWKTNATKKYYAVTGKLNLDEEKDLASSKLFPHLEELNLADQVAFYKDRKQGTPVMRLMKPEKIKTEYNTDIASLSNPDKPVIVVSEKRRAESTTEPETDAIVSISKPSQALPKTELNAIDNKAISIQPKKADKEIAQNTPPIDIVSISKPSETLPKTELNAIDNKAISIQPKKADKEIAQNTPPIDIVSISKPSETLAKTELNKVDKKTVPVQPKKIEKGIAQNKPPEIKKEVDKTDKSISKNDLPKQPEEQKISVSKQETAPTIDITEKVALLGGRKSEFSQMVSFKSDSLELALYDNGEVDGDTVSVYLDGEVILSRQCLKSSAIKKTIHIKPGNENFTLVLFAENLGKYPPNTGLLVIHDGEDVYNLRFSSDLQKNAGIVFKRKR